MKFQHAEPTVNYSTLRLVSEEGLWEFGLSMGPVGLRLRMGRSGRPPRVLDFCLGLDSALYGPVLWKILERLEGVREDCAEKEIDRLFPWAGTRPDLSIHLSELFLDEWAQRENKGVP